MELILLVLIMDCARHVTPASHIGISSPKNGTVIGRNFLDGEVATKAENVLIVGVLMWFFLIVVPIFVGWFGLVTKTAATDDRRSLDGLPMDLHGLLYFLKDLNLEPQVRKKRKTRRKY